MFKLNPPQEGKTHHFGKTFFFVKTSAFYAYTEITGISGVSHKQLFYLMSSLSHFFSPCRVEQKRLQLVESHWGKQCPGAGGSVSPGTAVKDSGGPPTAPSDGLQSEVKGHMKQHGMNM